MRWCFQMHLPLKPRTAREVIQTTFVFQTQMCNCKKSECTTKACGCRKKDTVCSETCGCINCQNREKLVVKEAFKKEWDLGWDSHMIQKVESKRTYFEASLN